MSPRCRAIPSRVPQQYVPFPLAPRALLEWVLLYGCICHVSPCLLKLANELYSIFSPVLSITNEKLTISNLIGGY